MQMKRGADLTLDADWLTAASERIEKTIELINIKKIKEALGILLKLDDVLSNSGIAALS